MAQHRGKGTGEGVRREGERREEKREWHIVHQGELALRSWTHPADLLGSI